jgi:hypothetical protein
MVFVFTGRRADETNTVLSDLKFDSQRNIVNELFVAYGLMFYFILYTFERMRMHILYLGITGFLI